MRGWLRGLLVTAALVAVVASVFAVLQVRTVRHTWSGLRSADAAVGVPDGFRQIRRREEGTANCFISCDEARIVMGFETSAGSPDEACAAVAAHVVRALQVDAEAPPSWVSFRGCLYAPLPKVGEQADLWVWADVGSQGDPLCHDETMVCVWVRLNSGLE